jgi:hypothetical protein
MSKCWSDDKYNSPRAVFTDIDARLAALEDATKDLQHTWQATADMELRNETRIAAIEANASVAANCAPAPAPTKRQQVAEHLLTRLQEMRACQILRVAVSDLAEGEYDVSARLVMQVVNIIEEAAREEQE